MGRYTQRFVNICGKRIVNQLRINTVIFMSANVLKYYNSFSVVVDFICIFLKNHLFTTAVILIPSYVKMLADLKCLAIHFVICVMRTDILLLRNRAPHQNSS